MQMIVKFVLKPKRTKLVTQTYLYEEEKQQQQQQQQHRFYSTFVFRDVMIF